MLDKENGSYLINEDEKITAKNDNEKKGAENIKGESIKPDARISDNDLTELKNFYQTSKSSATAALVCVCLFILIIPIMVAGIIQLVWCVKCLLLKSDELKQDAILWGILGLLILPVVPIFIMKNKSLQVIKKYDPNFNKNKI